MPTFVIAVLVSRWQLEGSLIVETRVDDVLVVAILHAVADLIRQRKMLKLTNLHNTFYIVHMYIQINRSINMVTTCLKWNATLSVKFDFKLV